MDELKLLTGLWGAHVALALPFVAIVAWLARKRVRWVWWEGLVFLTPFSAWASLMFGNWIKRPKSLGNLGEFWFISLLVVAGVGARALLGMRGDRTDMRVGLLTATTVAAAALYLLAPTWPE